MTRENRLAGPTRVLRGAALGLAAVLITILGHLSGHGDLPEAGLLVLLVPLAVGLGTLVADKRRSGAWILGFVLALQVLFHLLLTIAAGHGHHGSLMPDRPMLVGHLIAAALIAGALGHGETLLQRWIAFWHALAIDLEWFPTPQSTTCTPAFLEPALASTSVLGHCIARRGPPVS